ncbi:hypothetical protein [Buttiauxella sp.]|uniref:hypothetical protein n=1 Tax=Buttiauxella sp. TaxID=1972222 RepID=UPI002B45C7F5|nr:hypothetical protein [Buttiauxella sp.]
MLLPLFALFFPVLNAQASDGVIHFQGAIVEGPCHLSSQEQSVAFTCERNGKPVVQTVAFNQLNNFKPDSDVPLTTHIHYLDAQHKLAVLEVTYR